MHNISLARSIAAVTALSVTVALLPAAFAFTDVSPSADYSTAIDALQSKGVVEGYSDGTFKPGSRINRAEFLAIILRSQYDEDVIDESPLTNRFLDMPSGPAITPAWYWRYVSFAADKGIVSGYPDGKFHAEREINFVEAAKILTLAYKQNIQGAYGEWYEPYARALESSKAIPPSIAKLDAAVTRGEMAEIMWRLSEGETDEPTKGYLNVKYPEMKVNMASDTPQFATSCLDLRAFAEEARTAQTMYYGRGMMDTAMPSAAPSGEKAANEAAQSGGGSDGDFSKTNVQVEGVDEADIVKTDGEYLYIVRNFDRSTVRIVKVSPTNALDEVAVIRMPEDGTYAQDLYIDGDKLVVMAQRQFYYIMDKPMPTEPGPASLRIAPDIWPGPYQTPRTDVKIYDVSNAASPKELRTLSFDGNSVTTRRIGSKVYLVLNQAVQWRGPMPLEKDLLPQMEDSLSGDTEPVTRCGNVMILPHIPQPQYMTVAVIDTANVNADVQTSVVLGSAENVYSSLKNLYVAATEWTYDWSRVSGNSSEKTNLYRFEFNNNGIEMKSQGSVPGHLKNQFSMDENAASFRITTTKSEQWGPNGVTTPSQNNLYVLNLSLEQVGEIENIAPGETIYSTRFVGDRGYIVTFKKIDPFFVIDLKDPRNPKILGKLKIPGYSDYLHPYDENHIIGFGKEATESKAGDFAWYQGMKVAIFDVTDVANPRELHKMTIGDRGTDSPLLWNHKALLFEKDRDLLAFPITVSKISDAQKQSNDGSAYGSPVFQGAHVYDISLEDGFDLRGTVTHVDDESIYDRAGDYWYSPGTDIERIVRVGSSLFTISQNGVRAHGETSVKEEGRMTFAK